MKPSGFNTELGKSTSKKHCSSERDLQGESSGERGEVVARNEALCTAILSVSLRRGLGKYFNALRTHFLLYNRDNNTNPRLGTTLDINIRA